MTRGPEKPPSSVPPAESPDDLPYSAEDLETWKDGAETFRRFWNNLSEAQRTSFHPNSLGELQAMFLNEKPAVFMNHSALRVFDNLKDYGFEQRGLYIYRPSAVQDVITKHLTLFQAWHATTLTSVFEKLESAEGDEMHELRGLILGIPWRSVQAFERVHAFKIGPVARRLLHLTTLSPDAQEYLVETFFKDRKDKAGIMAFFQRELIDHAYDLGIEEEDIPNLLNELRLYLDADEVNIHGFGWIDYDHNQESKNKQARLKAAFEYSGIMKQG